MNRLIILFLYLPLSAHAWDFEIGAGVARYTPMRDGIWYQEGFPHKLQLTAPALQIGVAGNLLPHLDWHADYVYLGQVRSDAIATTDENYNLTTKSCNGTCTNRDRLIGYGSVHGIKLSLEPYFIWRGIRFAIEGGIFAFKPFYHVTGTTNPVENNYQPMAMGDVTHRSKIQFSPMLGASIGYKNAELSYQYFNTRAWGDQWDTVYNRTHVLQIRYRF